MNRWKFLLSWASVFGFLVCPNEASSVSQRSVESYCGLHPLIALAQAAASRPFASNTASLSELLRAVRADPDVWGEMQILLRRYDDCVRAGDGLHFKRSIGAPNVRQFSHSSIPDQKTTLQEFSLLNDATET